MFDLDPFVQLFLTVLGVAGVLGGAWGVFTVRRYKEAIEFNQETVNAYKQRTELLQTQYDEEKEERKKVQSQLLNLEKQLSEVQGRLAAYQELIKNPDGLNTTLSDLSASLKQLTQSAAIAEEAAKFMKDVREGKLLNPPNITI